MLVNYGHLFPKRRRFPMLSSFLNFVVANYQLKIQL